VAFWGLEIKNQVGVRKGSARGSCKRKKLLGPLLWGRGRENQKKKKKAGRFGVFSIDSKNIPKRSKKKSCARWLKKQKKEKRERNPCTIQALTGSFQQENHKKEKKGEETSLQSRGGLVRGERLRIKATASQKRVGFPQKKWETKNALLGKKHTFCRPAT